MTTPITGPCTISTYGEYYLANDIVSSTSPAINIQSYCRINPNGKTISVTCSDSAASPNIGILVNAASPYQVNIEGTLYFSGVRFGILSSSPYTRIGYGVDFSGCKYCGVSFSQGADNSWVRYCSANGIGGITDDAYAIGVNVGANNCLVDSNQFTNIYRQSGASSSLVGEGCPVILSSSSSNGIVRNNFIMNDTAQANTIGVFGGAGGSHVISRNVFKDFNIGIQGGGSPSSALTIEKNVLWMESLAGSVGIQAVYGTASYNLLAGYDTAFNGSITQTGNTVYP